MNAASLNLVWGLFVFLTPLFVPPMSVVVEGTVLVWRYSCYCMYRDTSSRNAPRRRQWHEERRACSEDRHRE